MQEKKPAPGADNPDRKTPDHQSRGLLDRQRFRQFTVRIGTSTGGHRLGRCSRRRRHRKTVSLGSLYRKLAVGHSLLEKVLFEDGVSLILRHSLELAHVLQ